MTDTHPFSYVGKHAVVTGSSSGVGAALVEVLAALDASTITGIDRNPPAAGAKSTTYVHADLSDPESVEATIEAIEGPIDVLFNNAGIAATQKPMAVMSVNYLALRRLSEGLLARIPSGGAIVNTASIAGGRWAEHLTEINALLDVDGWDKSLAWLEDHESLLADPYTFSKEVVQVWTMRSSHTSLQRGVRTNSVCPAPIDTPLLVDFRQTMTDKVIDWCIDQAAGRTVTPHEVATVLAFLGSEAASYVNGVNLNVDSGFNAAMTTNQVDFSGLA